ncbi:MAG: hypothetical protein F4Z96_04350 [Chloroflexi bacterium]|nr:hypothetical protein [Chloroflexota bacterium]
MLLTRARYFLFVPWLFREGERRGYRGPRLVTWVDGRERRLIGALQSGGDTAGLIGQRAGPAVQILPSTIYWNSLRRFGILRHDGTIAQAAGHRQTSRPAADATEYLEASDAVWAPSIPPPPDDFFRLDECDFALTHDEATWLAERIVDAVPDTLLQFLVLRGTRPSPTADFPWQEPAAHEAPEHILDALAEARRFAVTMHGAALLYNVLLAERAEELGLTDHDGCREEYTGDLDDWRDEIEASDIASWDLDGLWALVAKQGRPVSIRTRSFVAEWVDAARSQTGSGLADDQRARRLVRDRELHQKGSQARLRNDRLMRQWGGASGTDRLNFRWPFLARLLRDIADGRER